METIGKVLSLTLLTIFGSAAAAVYLVDSNFFPSFLEKTPIVYTSDSRTHDQDPAAKAPGISDHSKYRKEHSETYFEVSSLESHKNSEENDAIWGQSYGTAQPYTKSDRAVYLASVNSLASLNENLKHWNSQYKQARNLGQSRTANLAYSNYKDYEKAIEIKSNSTSN
jgi:hypothetical protein